jgi:anti-sigma factor RsiW
MSLSACAEFEALLVAYDDGELSDIETRRVEAHMAACAACPHVLEEIRGTLALLGDYLDQPVGVLPRAKPKRFPLKWLAAAAAGLLLWAGGSFLYRGGLPTSRAEAAMTGLSERLDDLKDFAARFTKNYRYEKIQSGNHHHRC